MKRSEEDERKEFGNVTINYFQKKKNFLFRDEDLASVGCRSNFIPENIINLSFQDQRRFDHIWENHFKYPASKRYTESAICLVKMSFILKKEITFFLNNIKCRRAPLHKCRGGPLHKMSSVPST